MIERLQFSIAHCENRSDLDQLFNHISIFTIFILEVEHTSIKKKKLEKKRYEKINDVLAFIRRFVNVSKR